MTNGLIRQALRNVTVGWKCTAKEWKEAISEFAIAYADRFGLRAVKD